jgi:hypothetical protein
MPEPTDQPAKPLRTWRPMAAWSGAILLALGLVWFVGAVVVPVWQVRTILAEIAQTDPSAIAIPSQGLSVEFYGLASGKCQEAVERMGGPRKASRTLGICCRLPRKVLARRDACFELLTHCGPDGLATLKRLGRSPDPERRHAALMAIGDCHQADGPTVQLLTSALREEHPFVRLAAATALGQIGPEGVPVLVQELQSTDPTSRALAARGLACADHSTMRVVPILLQVASDEDDRVRAAVTYALGGVGKSVDAPTKERVCQALRKAAEDKNSDVREAAARSLLILNPPSGRWRQD